MLARARRSRLVVAVAALYAVAAVLIGFAHRAPAVAGADLAAYMLGDGTVPDLCLSGTDDASGRAGGVACDACLLTSAPGLGPVQVATLVPPVTAAAVVHVAEAPARAVISIFRPTSRGPPVSPITAA